MSSIVSIIVPNYNHALYLHKRLDSIFSQTFHNFEVILLDDCSTDNSVRILNYYGPNPKVSHLIINKKNSGSPFYQWKKGIELAKGEYIWIAESDDWCEPEFLSTAMEHLERENANIFYCASTFYIQEHNQFENAPDAINDFTQKGTDFLFYGLLKDNLLRNASAVVFKKELIKKFPKKITRFKVAGDWVFWTYLCCQPETIVTYSSKPMNYFRLHLQSSAAQGKKKGLAVFEGISILLEAKKNKSIQKSKKMQSILDDWYNKIHEMILKNIHCFNKKTIYKLLITTLRINFLLGFKILRTARFYYYK